MAINISRGGTDPGLDEFVQALGAFQADHPAAEIDLFRHGRYSVRVRIIDPAFAGQSKTQRHRSVWPYLEKLPEETLSDLSTLLILTPDEKASSFASFEFDDPVPAVL